MVSLPADFKLASITSAANIPGTEKFLVTLTQPSSKNEMLRVPHLYEATYDKLSGFNAINPWEYSGIEDSTSCGYATINAGGNMVVFSKQGKNTKGADLYLSKRTGDSWSKPESLAVLNTEMDEMAPMFSGDSLLTFASNGRPGYGGLDLYSVKLDGSNFGEIKHLKAPINSFRDDLNLTWFNDSVALFTSNRLGGKGDDDVYSAYFEKEKLPVTDTVNHELEEYLANWTDKIILFDYDKYSIKDQKMIEEIAEALKKIKGLEVVIEGRTDSRGVEIYNMELGRQRALSVRNEFIKLGVQDSSIETISKGEEEAIVDCSKGCSEEQHQQNRVAIIKIKKN
jgi:outer membrane protein OmpA-like peptidoglycan-associated protein